LCPLPLVLSLGTTEKKGQWLPQEESWRCSGVEGRPAMVLVGCPPAGAAAGALGWSQGSFLPQFRISPPGSCRVGFVTAAGAVSVDGGRPRVCCEKDATRVRRRGNVLASAGLLGTGLLALCGRNIIVVRQQRFLRLKPEHY